MRAFIFLVALASFAICTSVDLNTFSNYQDVHLDHVHIEWLLDLDNKHIDATALYDFTVTAKAGISQVWLDIYQLDIFLVFQIDGTPLDFSIEQIGDQSLIQGDRLVVKLASTQKMGSKFQFKVKYLVDTRSRALSFMNKEQTLDKKQPYLFSQCETNNCRSMIPLQDTPANKQTYSATVLVRPGVSVFMSGNSTTALPLIGQYDSVLTAEYNTFGFESKIAIPSYLIAIVAGAVEERKIGVRTSVISEPSALDAVAKDMADLELYLETLEAYIGVYKWGSYKLVIQPPSFPFGGMENPLLTFASPSIIVGDKSGAAVAIHEIAHSWTGNTVTCVNWSNFWINEGFTVFLERKALSALPEFGSEWALIDKYVGNSDFQTAVDGFGATNSYSSLFPITEGVNPDDSFSTIPYEKGFQFLSYLETLLNPADFQSMLKHYIFSFEYQSIDNLDFKEFLTQWIALKYGEESADTITHINNVWATWIQTPGMSPVNPSYSSLKITQAQDLAQSYIDSKGKSTPAKAGDFASYLTNQKYVFLQYLLDNVEKVDSKIILLIEIDLLLTESLNKEILYRWFTLCLKCNYQIDIEDIHNFLGAIGRQKMILPVYRELNIVNPAVAQQYFEEYKSFYHPLAVKSINEILNPSSLKIE